MKIEKARIEQAEEIQKLITNSVQPESNEDFDEQGLESFYKLNDIESITERIISPDYLTLCCWLEEKLVGMIAIFDNEKLDQLFVDPAFWRRGISKKLWAEAKSICEKRGNSGHFWVKSSAAAISTYKSFGFKQTSGRCENMGISYYSMVLDD